MKNTKIRVAHQQNFSILINEENTLHIGLHNSQSLETPFKDACPSNTRKIILDAHAHISMLKNDGLDN